MTRDEPKIFMPNGRSPLGLRGLKYIVNIQVIFFRCRSPLGLRGLK